MRKIPVCFLLSLISILFLASSNANAQAYNVTELKSIPPYYWTTPLGLNASGEVVGASTKNVFGGEGSTGLAFRWTKATGIQSLGAGFASSINNSGDIAGFSGAPLYHAFLWKHDGTTQDLGTLSGFSSEAWAINTGDGIVGDSVVAGSTDSHAFLWMPQGGMQDLGTLTGSYFSTAQGINDSRQVVGWDDVHNGNEIDAFSWTQSGGMQDIAQYSNASSINGSGVIAGTACSASVCHAQFWEGGTAHDLGTLGGTQSNANAINGSGVVVGSSTTTTAENSPVHAFVWTATAGMQDLNLLVPANIQQKFVLQTGVAGNHAGQIAVQAYPLTGTRITYGFLLSPQMNVSLSSSQNPSVVGQTVTFTAKITSIAGHPPNGEGVTFKNGATMLGTTSLKGGVATFETSTLTQATHTITATYAGDANYASAKSAVLSQVVNK